MGYILPSKPQPMADSTVDENGETFNDADHRIEPGRWVDDVERELVAHDSSLATNHEKLVVRRVLNRHVPENAEHAWRRGGNVEPWVATPTGHDHLESEPGYTVPS
jgi:hypothetical protein